MGGAEADRLIGQHDMGSASVGVAEDSDGPQLKFGGRAQDATGDLAPIGDQDAVEELVPTQGCVTITRTDVG